MRKFCPNNRGHLISQGERRLPRGNWRNVQAAGFMNSAARNQMSALVSSNKRT